MEKTVILAELKWFGHYETQLKVFVEIILKWGWKVIVLCPEPKVMDDWVDCYFPDFKGQFYSAYFSDRTNSSFFEYINLWRRLTNCINLAEKNTKWRADVVFLTWLDGLLPKSMWQSFIIRNFYITFPWVGLYFLPKPYRRDVEMGWLKRLRRVAREKVILNSYNCRNIGVFDEGSYDALSKELAGKPITLLPDVTEEQLPERTVDLVAKIRQRAGDRPIVGLIGILSPRKGVLNFLRSINEIDSSQCFFLIAGKLDVNEYSSKVRGELSKLLHLGNKENCYFHLEYIEHAEIVNTLVNMCDILYLAYEKFYFSSGFLTKAAVFKKLVIASKTYSMGKRVEEYRMGLTVAEGNLQETVKAIKYLSDKDNRKAMHDHADFNRYYSFHQLSTLDQTLFTMFTNSW